jgi:hypothetical protein
MSRIVQATYYDDTREWVYVTDDFCRLVHDTRTGEWTLFRIPTPAHIMDTLRPQSDDNKHDLMAFTAPIRYVPPVQADLTAAPRFDAEVAVDD